jgi:uncharacterized membrane protein
MDSAGRGWDGDRSGGLVIGTLFVVPVVGGLAGAAIGALAKATEDAAGSAADHRLGPT